MGQRQTRQPVIGAGFDTEPGARGPGAGQHRSMGQDHSLGIARASAGGNNERIARFDGHATNEPIFAVGADHRTSTEPRGERLPHVDRQPLIEWQCSVASIPDPLERVDKFRSAIEIEGNQVGH